MPTFKQRFSKFFGQCLPGSGKRNLFGANSSSSSPYSRNGSTPDDNLSHSTSESNLASKPSKRLEYEGSVTPNPPTEEMQWGAENIVVNSTTVSTEILQQSVGVRYTIDIVHDGEKCPIRMSTNGHRLFDVVIASVLDAIGVRMDIREDVNIDSICDVNWRFVFPIGDSRFFPTKALKELLSRGVVHINPGGKMGAVGNVLTDAIDQLCNEHLNDSESKKQKRIIVIITSDRDYSSSVRRLRQCGLRTVLIYTPSKYTPNFPHMMPLDHALSIWDDIVDETEMDATDLHHFSQRLSFRMQPQPRPGDSPALSEKDDFSVDVENEADIVSDNELTIHDAPAPLLIPEEEDIPDFKFGCAKDLYLFLLDRNNSEIETHQLNLFWDHYPQHRHEIGRIRNFCMSAKAEGAFNCAENASGSFTLSIIPPHLRKKPLVLSPGSHHGKGKKILKKKGSKFATHIHAVGGHVKRAHVGSPGGMQSPGSTPRNLKLYFDKSDKSDKESSSEQSRDVNKTRVYRGRGSVSSAAANSVLNSHRGSSVKYYLLPCASDFAFVLCAILAFVALAYSYLYKDEALWTALSHVSSAAQTLQRARLWWLTERIHPESFLKYVPPNAVSFFQSLNISTLSR